MNYTKHANERYTMALWYAWGYIDASADPNLTLDDGFRFSDIQRDQAEAYETGTTNHMESIINGWNRYLNDGKGTK